MYIDIFLGMVFLAGVMVAGISIYNHYATQKGYMPLPLFNSPTRGGRGGGRGGGGRGGRGGGRGRGEDGRGMLMKEASFQTIDSSESYTDRRGGPRGASPNRGGKGNGSRDGDRFSMPKKEDSYRSAHREDSARFHINQIKNGGYYTKKERKQEYV